MKDPVKRKVGNVLNLPLRILDSIIKTRAGLSSALGDTFGGSRNFYEVLGYKKELSFLDYFDRYERDSIAARIIDAPSKATWSELPKIIPQNEKNEDIENEEFTVAIEHLFEKFKMRGVFERVDRLAGIGRFGVILLGTPGDVRSNSGPLNSVDDLLFVTPYGEGSTTIERFETSTSNPRFSLPTLYNITSNTGQDSEVASGISLKIHHSRIIHVAEDILENRIYGKPRLKKVYNLFDDLAKVVGGSAEFFWRIADRGIQFDLDPDVELNDDDEDDFSDEIDDYMHGLKRHIKTRGITAKVLGSETADPRGPFTGIISLISGATGIPQRILTGSERGQLASDQDKASWNERIFERQKIFAEPMVIRPFIDWAMRVKIVQQVPNYRLAWPVLRAQTETERSQTALRVSTSLNNLAKAQATLKDKGVDETTMTFEEFQAKFLDF